uniref:SH2 domain-containing protein n=1 Tax=Trichogramma kaykai TaxID=54128 RepID=A0ABD2WZI7_9HYME
MKREVDGADLYSLSESRFFKSVVELIEYYERVSRTENFKKLDQRLQWPYRCILAKALFGFQGGERNELTLQKGRRVGQGGRCQRQDQQSGRLLPQ